MAKKSSKENSADKEAEADDNIDVDFSSLANLLPKYSRLIPLIVLALIVLYGISLRAYHIDYPVIGYHNTKEAHTLGEARNMYLHGNWFMPDSDYYSVYDEMRGVHGDNFPILAWVIVIAWKILGMRLWVARGVMILFSVGIIVLNYLIVKYLFRREDMALLSALLAAVTPLMVFFGRNVQYDLPSTFFLMLAIYTYLLWRKEPKIVWFGLMAVSTAIGVASKWSTAILVVPIVLTFPVKRLVGFKKYIKQYVIVIPCVLLMMWWWVHCNNISPETSATGTSFFQGHILGNLGQVFTINWWSIVYNYAGMDNFSYAGVWLMILGFILTLLLFRRFRYRFLAWWGLSFFPYAFVTANFLSHHNYYQTPYAPLASILIAVFLFFIATVLPKINIKGLERSLRWLGVCLIFFLFLVPGILIPERSRNIKRCIAAQFDTQFYGLDIAGDYLRTHSRPGDVVFESAHQDRGLLWHSGLDMVKGIVNESTFAFAEEQLNVRWVFVYQWGFKGILGNEELATYIYNHYSLRQAAFLQQGDQLAPLYLLFERGGSYNQSELNNIKPQHMKDYELTVGKVRVWYANLE